MRPSDRRREEVVAALGDGWVNGWRVERARLHAGDRLALADVRVLLEPRG